MVHNTIFSNPTPIIQSSDNSQQNKSSPPLPVCRRSVEKLSASMVTQEILGNSLILLKISQYSQQNLNFFFLFFFSIWVFFHEHSRITGLQGKGEGISLTPHYHFHSFHRQLDITRAITAESSPLHIASSRTRTGNLWLPSASR